MNFSASLLCTRTRLSTVSTKNIFRRIFVLGGVVFGAISCTATPSLEEETSEALSREARNASVNAVSTASRVVVPGSAADRIFQDVSWLSDDAREGRDSGSEGYLAAANYVADRFKALGISPGSDGDYYQNVGLRKVKRDNDAAFLSLTNNNGETTILTHKQDFIAGRSLQGENFSVTAPLVFAGFGVTAPGYDDYDGIDVEGKIVVIFSGAPSSLNSETRSHVRSGRTKAMTARKNGAAGIITISSNTREPEAAWKRSVNFPEREAWTWVSADGIANDASHGMAPTFVAGPELAETIFANSGRSFAQLRDLANAKEQGADFSGFDLSLSATVKGGGLVEDLSSPNVVGFLEGSDPTLRDEVIVLSAHLDHVGVHEPRGGGTDHIHNGALDNAMGIATMLEVAKRMTEEGGARRSIIFLAVTAEEKGLLGSDYFANFPTVDADRIVANVNLDMPLVLYPFTDVVAFGAKRSSLGETVRAAAAKTDVEIIDDPWPSMNLFVRSDHYNFVRKGIPSVFLFLGTGNGGQEVFDNFLSTNYHQPSDQIDLDIHWNHAARFANLNYLIAREIADAGQRPAWNEGDFFGETFGNE